MNLTQRKANINDLPAIVKLLADDELGQTRENPLNLNLYLKAFEKIDADLNQYIMVVFLNDRIIGTCHLTIMPSLTYEGATRMQIEAVRVAKGYQGQKIGEWMIMQSFEFARKNEVKIIQLTTNKLRPKAKKFYENLGFKTTHEGMKFVLSSLS